MFHWNEFDTIKKRCTLFKVGNSKNAKHTKGLDSAWIFDNLKIAGNEYYEKHLNQHNAIFTEADQKKYLDFLRNLLKDRPYVELAYMTGVLPIKKYSSGSELNMFDEFYFPTDTIYDTFFGFTEEVKELCERNKKIAVPSSTNSLPNGTTVIIRLRENVCTTRVPLTKH